MQYKQTFYMEPDSILKEVHAMKESVARESDYDIHTLFKHLREIDGQNRDRVVSLLPPQKTPSEGQGAPGVATVSHSTSTNPK